jgi:hypothetical protein
VSQESTNRTFDDLARALAEGSISRRRALKLFAGTAIAALIPARAMAITCPPGTVKICHVPRRADGTCRRGEAETRCVTEEQAARHARHPCDCCGGCGGTDDCREPRPRTCFSTTPPTSCTPAADRCSSANLCGTGNCACIPIVEGGATCVTRVCTGAPCTSSAQCPSGICGGALDAGGCCAQNVCQTPCPT